MDMYIEIQYMCSYFYPKEFHIYTEIKSNLTSFKKTESNTCIQGGLVPACQPGDGRHLHREPGGIHHQIRGQGHRLRFPQGHKKV
jgi:hypothetical protein